MFVGRNRHLLAGSAQRAERTDAADSSISGTPIFGHSSKDLEPCSLAPNGIVTTSRTPAGAEQPATSQTVQDHGRVTGYDAAVAPRPHRIARVRLRLGLWLLANGLRLILKQLEQIALRQKMAAPSRNCKPDAGRINWLCELRFDPTYRAPHPAEPIWWCGELRHRDT